MRKGGYPPPPRGESRLPPLLTVVLAIALQLLLPSRLTVGPKWILPALEGLMLISLVIVSPQRHVQAEHLPSRRIALAIAALVSIANATSLALLAHHLLHQNVTNGRQLVISGTLIWLTNVLVFALWYWETDRGGPGTRAAGHDGRPDFLFPQMSDDRWHPGWRPMFMDYLYVSLTNAAAFSPTDTMPLSITVKAIMGLQSLISLVTIGLVVSRAVNILA
ncbi:MAG TPA: hypothetical protein VGI55_17905 [Solirubrobacteraceae bacterium]|jgi:uncharacterized membrane protein